MLEWIEMALNSSRQENRDLYVSRRITLAALAAVRRVPIHEVELNWGASDNEKLDVYSAAVILMNEVRIVNICI
jgi:hypothetical protein